MACQLQMAALEPLQHVLAASKVRVIFLSSSEPWQTEEFLSKSVVQFPGELFSDPTLKIHKAFQLKRGVWKSLVTPLWPGFRRYGVMGIIEGIRLGMEFSNLVGDSWQQGGTFVISWDSKIMYGHTEEYPGDWDAMDKALNACGIDINIDYHMAIEKWLALRGNRRSSQHHQTSNFLFWIIFIFITYIVFWLIR